MVRVSSRIVSKRLFLRFPVAMAAVLLASGSASAAGYVSPAIGVAFNNPSAQGQADLVADVGWIAREPLGVELDTMYAPNFFGANGSSGGSGVTTVMANVVIAGTTGGRYQRQFREAALRPYLSAGLGLLHQTSTASNSTIASDRLGTNLGIGVMAVSRRQIGVRADVRYFRDLAGQADGAVTVGSFHFWRASLGAVLAF